VRFDDYFAKKMLVNSSLNYLCFVHSSCYFVEILFVALEGGNVLKCSTSTNPATILTRWSFPELKRILCLFFFYKM